MLALCLGVGPDGRARAAGPLLTISEVRTDRFPEVSVVLTVVDGSGVPIADLDPDRFRVTHNGQPVPDLAVESTVSPEEGLAAVLAIDTSGSMRGQPLEDAKAAVRVFTERMGPHDRLAVLSFNSTVETLQDFTGDRATLDAAVERLTAGGDTRLYDAMSEGATGLASQPLGRRALVVITDGEDTTSSASLDDVIARAHDANVPVYAIGFGEVKADPLEQVTAVTGGRYREAPDASALSEGLRILSDALRRRYVLSYQATDSQTTDNQVDVTVSLDGVEVHDDRRFSSPPMPPLEVSLPDLADGSTVRGLVDLHPMLGNARRVDHVEYLLDGTLLRRETAAPWAFSWDTGTVTAGRHELVVQARVGDREARRRLGIVVSPAVTIAIRPLGEPAADGTVTLTADVDAVAPVQRVEWTVDGVVVGRSTASPYGVTWNSAGSAPGEHLIAVEARDESGHSAHAERTMRLVATAGSAVTVVAQPTAAGSTPVVPTVAAAPTPGVAPTLAPAGAGISGDRFRLSTGMIAVGLSVLALAIGGVWFIARRSQPAGRPSDRGSTLTLTERELPATVLAEAAPKLQLPPASGLRESPAELAEPETVTTEALTEMAEAVTETTRPLGASLLGRRGSGDNRAAERPGWDAEPDVPPRFPTRAPLRRNQARIVITEHGLPAETWFLGLYQVIGREPGARGITLRDPAVSRHHARLSWTDGRFVFTDLSPTNATLINGRPYSGAVILSDNDHLRLGHAELVFRAGPDTDTDRA